jgi:hypothetical protein
MKEQRWNTCREPQPMLTFAQKAASARKLRLVASACCRRVAALLLDPRSLASLEVNERYASGLANLDELDRAREEAKAAFDALNVAIIGPRERAAAWSVWAALRQRGKRTVTQVSSTTWVEAAVRTAGGWEWHQNPEERLAQADLLRDIVNPFLRSRIDPLWLAWEGGIVARLALGIYEERSFDKLTILADALEDAGCQDIPLLEHLRQGGEHARGCWALDFILGRG